MIFIIIFVVAYLIFGGGTWLFERGQALYDKKHTPALDIKAFDLKELYPQTKMYEIENWWEANKPADTEELEESDWTRNNSDLRMSKEWEILFGTLSAESLRKERDQMIDALTKRNREFERVQKQNAEFRALFLDTSDELHKTKALVNEKSALITKYRSALQAIIEPMTEDEIVSALQKIALEMVETSVTLVGDSVTIPKMQIRNSPTCYDAYYEKYNKYGPIRTLEKDFKVWNSFS